MKDKKPKKCINHGCSEPVKDGELCDRCWKEEYYRDAERYDS